MFIRGNASCTLATCRLRGMAFTALLVLAFAPPLTAQEAVPLIVRGDPILGGIIVGEGARTIVALHGGPAVPFDRDRAQSSPLQREGRVVFYDQRGCGQSGPAESYDWRDHVADLDRVLSHVSPDQPVVLAGGSWGAMLALLYALEHPHRVRALILRGVPRWTDGRRGRLTVDSILSRELERGCIPVRTATWDSLIDRPGLDQLRTIQAPTLLISGSEDAFGALELSQVVPRARLVLVPGAGHVVDYEQPDRFFSEVSEFLASVDKPRR